MAQKSPSKFGEWLVTYKAKSSSEGVKKTTLDNMVASKFQDLADMYAGQRDRIRYPILPCAQNELQLYAANPTGDEEALSFLLERYKESVTPVGESENPLISFIVKQLESREMDRSKFDAIVDCAFKVVEANPRVSRLVSDTMLQCHSFFRADYINLWSPEEQDWIEQEKSHRKEKLQGCVKLMTIVETSQSSGVKVKDAVKSFEKLASTTTTPTKTPLRRRIVDTFKGMWLHNNVKVSP
jgi:hypothetical protein